MAQQPDMMDKLISLAKRRGFIFPGSEIYGGLQNSWDYGPLGVELKNNIKKLWWKMFVQERPDMVGLDAAIIMNPNVWKASGHIGNFNDPLIECKKCHQRFREDHLSEVSKKLGTTADWDNLTPDEQKLIRCPEKGSHDLSNPNNDLTKSVDFNMMLETVLGPVVKSTDDVVYFRPETAQAIFVDFPNILETSRKRVPFGVAQIGKAFRNEITPGNFIFRTREFEQMEIEYFIHPSEWEKHFELWLAEMKRWIAAIGLDESKVHYEEIGEADRAFYSKRTIDIEFDYPFGQKELYGLAYRADYDLAQHEKHSGKELKYTDPVSNEKYLPHVIEPSLGVDRTVLAVLLSAYTETEARSGKGDAVHEKEVTLRLPKALAPIKIAILPLSKKPELSGPATDLYHNLQKRWMCQYDETGSIGKRYRRQDEIGTPYCLTMDFDSLNDQAVTIRDRDTMAQERVAIADLENYFTERLGC